MNPALNPFLAAEAGRGSQNNGYSVLTPSEKPLSYLEYHRRSLEVGDVDPSYEMLRYVCNRFELSTEQRYWLAFLYATCYCGPTVFYIYNEFPDFENVDEGRLERWWAENRQKLYFQTDKRWVRSRNQWCDVFRSYKAKAGRLTQEQLFKTFRSSSPFVSYDAAWSGMSDLYQFGRFAMFLYLEAVHVVTGFPMKPSSMDLRDAESCRNGLAFAVERPDLLTGENQKRLSAGEMTWLQKQFENLTNYLQHADPKNTVWNIETSLCAYKKYRIGKRWIGYYLDRQFDEIVCMEKKVTEGVDWSVLWDYRRETYQHHLLKEFRK